jgi:hypothetical protein
MLFKLTVRETVEREFLVEAASVAEVRDIFERTPLSDLEEPEGEEVVERKLVRVQKGGKAA